VHSTLAESLIVSSLPKSVRVEIEFDYRNNLRRNEAVPLVRVGALGREPEVLRADFTFQLESGPAGPGYSLVDVSSQFERRGRTRAVRVEKALPITLDLKDIHLHRYLRWYLGRGLVGWITYGGFFPTGKLDWQGVELSRLASPDPRELPWDMPQTMDWSSISKRTPGVRVWIDGVEDSSHGKAFAAKAEQAILAAVSQTDLNDPAAASRLFKAISAFRVSLNQVKKEIPALAADQPVEDSRFASEVLLGALRSTSDELMEVAASGGCGVLVSRLKEWRLGSPAYFAEMNAARSGMSLWISPPDQLAAQGIRWGLGRELDRRVGKRCELDGQPSLRSLLD
jgi:hypothetical protein